MFADPITSYLQAWPVAHLRVSRSNQALPGITGDNAGQQPGLVWLGLGVDQDGVDSATWSDHTDIRSTMLMLSA